MIFRSSILLTLYSAFDFDWFSIFLTIITILALILNAILNANTIKSINNLQFGLDSFFSYLNGKTTKITKLDDSSKDEFGAMSHDINNNIEIIRKNLELDLGVYGEIMAFGEKMGDGHFDTRIHLKASNKNINRAVQALNDLSSEISINISSCSLLSRPLKATTGIVLFSTYLEFA